MEKQPWSKAKSLAWALPASILLLVGAGCGSNGAPAGGTPAAYAPTPAPTPAPAPQPKVADPAKEIAFRAAMNRLWEDHITWTRLYIISVAEGLKDKDQAAARLLKNQEDIGNAIKPYYGEEAGNKLTALLKEHITGAVKILDAAKDKDTATMNREVNLWYANGDEIAAFLSTANPQNWPLQAMKDAMKMHLDTTLAEATDRLNGRYAQDVKDYDAVKDHIYKMADVLATGIIKQFPDKF